MTRTSAVLWIVLLITPLFGLGVDLYAPSMPAIGAYFQISHSAVKLTLIFYLIGYGVGQVVFGPLSDRFGRKKILKLGLGVYVLITIFLACTHHPTGFLIGRFLQGFFIATAGIMNKALLVDHFSGKALAKATTYMVIVWAISPIVAPAIGSYIQAYLSWQMNFVLLAAYGTIAFVLSQRFVVEIAQTHSVLQFKKIYCDYLEMVWDQKFVGLALILAITYALLVTLSLAAPFMIQIDLEQSVLVYGRFALLMGIGFFLGTMLNRFLIIFLSQKTLIYVSLWIAIVMAMLMLYWNIVYPLTLTAMGIPVFFIIVCSAIVTPNSYALSLQLFSEKAGTATALRGIFTLVGASLLACPLLFIDLSRYVWAFAMEYLLLNSMALFIFYRFVNKRTVAVATNFIAEKELN